MATRTCSVAMAQLQTWWNLTSQLLALLLQLHHLQCQISTTRPPEWLTGTFRGKYKGKKDEFKGHYAIYFDRKNSFYLELNLSAYGCDQDWVIINKTK